MYKQTMHKEIMRAYATAQNNAHNLRDRRLRTLYKTVPRAMEIDRELAQLGLEAARMALSGDTHEPGRTRDLLDTLRKRQETLSGEKSALCAARGIPDNYLTDVYQCAKCADTGYINTQSANPTPCACFRQKYIDAYYEMSNLADVLAKENFDSFNLKLYPENLHADKVLSSRTNMEFIREEAELFVKDFGSTPANVLFYGPTGLGKTFMCHCIAKALLDKGYTVLYITAPKLFKQIHTQQFNRGEANAAEEKLDIIYDCDLLIIDDLGAEFSTVVTDSALFDVINQRHLDRRAVAISTNLTINELETQYTERIVSRLIGNYKWYPFYGDDIRIKQQTLGIKQQTLAYKPQP